MYETYQVKELKYKRYAYQFIPALFIIIYQLNIFWPIIAA